MKLSIIVPIYNVAAYLRKCVDSLLAQDISDYEIILVDDGSTDNSGAIADEILNAFRLSPLASRLDMRVIHQQNAGLSAARNSGIAIAQGDYTLFVDSDDYLQPNTLGTLLEQAERDNLDVLRFRYQNVKESGEAFAPYKDKTNYNDYSALPTDGLSFLNERMGTQCYVWQFMVKTKLVQMESFTHKIYLEDTDWTPRILLRAKVVASTDIIVYNYLWREGSITFYRNNKEKQAKLVDDMFFILNRIKQLKDTTEDCRWFDMMITIMVVNILGIIVHDSFKNRLKYIKNIKSLNLLPLPITHINPRAQRKVRLINFSIYLTVFILRLRLSYK